MEKQFKRLISLLDGAARVIELLGTEGMKKNYFSRLTRYIEIRYNNLKLNEFLAVIQPNFGQVVSG